MEQTTHRQMSESFRLGAVLALTGGFLDAYTYLIRGGVFANAQTGNIVLLGVRLMEGDWGRRRPLSGTHSGLCRGGTGGRADPRTVPGGPGPPLAADHRGGGAAPAGGGGLPAAALDNAANVLVAFVCAVQVESFRKVNGNAFATTMCTGNLRSGTERLYLWGKTGERDHGHRAAQYYGIIVFFIVGAALGAWCSGRWGQRAVLGACVLLLAAFLLMFQRKPLARTGKGV